MNYFTTEDSQKIHTEQMRLSEIQNKELQDKIAVINKNSEEYKNITEIQYNILNLPSHISFADGSSIESVSYTHLDVYKRQPVNSGIQKKR